MGVLCNLTVGVSVDNAVAGTYLNTLSIDWSRGTLGGTYLIFYFLCIRDYLKSPLTPFRKRLNEPLCSVERRKMNACIGLEGTIFFRRLFFYNYNPGTRSNSAIWLSVALRMPFVKETCKRIIIQ